MAQDFAGAVDYAGWGMESAGLDPGEEAGVQTLPVHVQPLVRSAIQATKMRMATPVYRQPPPMQRPFYGGHPYYGGYPPHVRGPFPLRPGPRYDGGAPNEMTGKRTTLGLSSELTEAPFIVFTATSGTALAFAVVPQRDFQGQRLVIETSAIGASATPLIGVVSEVTVGDIPQIPTTGGVPLGLFRPDATESAIDITNCRAGLTLRVVIELSGAPTGTDTFTVTAGFYGKVIGQ